MTHKEYCQAEEFIILEVIEDLLDSLSPEKAAHLAQKFQLLDAIRDWQKEVEPAYDTIKD